MKNKILLTGTLFLLAIAKVAAQSETITPDGTYMYERRDTCDLFLDVYNPAPGSETTFNGHEKPTVVFMFGGGFIRGTRDDSSYHSWFRNMTQNGYRIISIDYRLGLKGSTKVGVAQVNVLDRPSIWQWKIFSVRQISFLTMRISSGYLRTIS